MQISLLVSTAIFSHPAISRGKSKDIRKENLTFGDYFWSELTRGYFDDGGGTLWVLSWHEGTRSHTIDDNLAEKEEEIANFLSVPMELERVCSFARDTVEARLRPSIARNLS